MPQSLKKLATGIGMSMVEDALSPSSHVDEETSSPGAHGVGEDENVYAALETMKGGSEKTKGLDDMIAMAPMIATVTGIAAPEVALAIAATKILAQEMEARQKEADEMLVENRNRAKAARDESIELMNKMSLDFANKGNEELKKDMDKLSSKVRAAATFGAAGENFKMKILLNDLEDNAMKLPSGKGGVIESYETDEDLVASVSGGIALHGITLLFGDSPIESSSTPVLARPSKVEVMGVTKPFKTSTYKCTKESELSTFNKSASAGGLTMAENTMTSIEGNQSASGFGLSEETGFAASAANEASSSQRREEEKLETADTKTKTAIMVEYLTMPMRCVRISQDDMHLSKDAKHAIDKVQTLRQAMKFLRTYGTHVSGGKLTLGGVYFRTISMESTKATSSVEMYSAAGSEMSNTSTTTLTTSASTGASFGLFGMGPKGGQSLGTSFAKKSGGSSFETSSDSNGKNKATASYSYSTNVSSFGPNANTPDEFYSELNTNTATWAVIDQGELENITPIWDLIRQKLLVDGGDEHNKKIKKACRLLKRAWTTRTQEFLESPSPLRLPNVIRRTIHDFVAVNQSIGEMVRCICSVVKPENPTDPKKKSLIGNRTAMLKSLKEVVRCAVNEHLKEATEEFAYDNWFVKDFIEKGIKRMKEDGTLNKLEFKSFLVVPTEHDATEISGVSSFVRRMHNSAAEYAANLDEDAWEDLCDEFVTLARTVKMPHFYSPDDDERIARVWNLTNEGIGNGDNALIVSPVETIEVAPNLCAKIYCPDAVRPVKVTATPPFLFKVDWGSIAIEQHNRIHTIKLYPGMVYYWMRDKSTTTLLPADTILKRGAIIIENRNLPLEVSLHFPDTAHSITLPGNSIYVLEHEDSNRKQKVQVEIRRKGQEDDASTSPTSTLERGEKYLVHFENDDPLLLSSPTLKTQKEKNLLDRRNKGCLLVSRDLKRRIHEWSGGDTSVNAIESGFKYFSSDQFWTLVPVEPPKVFSYLYDPDHTCFLIVCKKSGSRLYAKFSSEDDGDSGSNNFGLVNNNEVIDGSQKWQIMKPSHIGEVELDGDNLIFNVSSDRWLGLGEENSVIAASEDLFASGDKERFQWGIVPWDDTKMKAAQVTYGLAKKTYVTGQPTLPDKKITKDGGIIISNESPLLFSISWKLSNTNGKYYRLGPTKRLILPFPGSGGTGKASINLKSASLLTEKTFNVEHGAEHYIYFPESDPLCLKMPEIETKKEKERKEKGRKGYLLISIPKEGSNDAPMRLGIDKEKKVIVSPHSSSDCNDDQQLWELQATSTKNHFKIVSKGSKGHYLSPSLELGGVVLLLDNATEWTFNVKESSVEGKKLSVKGVTECSIGLKTGNDSHWAIVEKDELTSSATNRLLPVSEFTSKHDTINKNFQTISSVDEKARREKMQREQQKAADEAQQQRKAAEDALQKLQLEAREAQRAKQTISEVAKENKDRLVFNFGSGGGLSGLTASLACQVMTHLPLTIKELSIEDADFGSEFVEALIQQVERFSNLEWLQISHVNVGDEKGGQEAGLRLAKVLATNTTITWLSLNNTDLIGSDNVMQWGDALMENKTLKHFGLWGDVQEINEKLRTRTKGRTPSLY